MLRRTKKERTMLTRILAASTLALGLATSAAMAQSTASDAEDMNGPPPATIDQPVDMGTTSSIYPDDMGMTSPYGPEQMAPCASAPGSLGPDANTASGPNDHYCGK
jgi:hypothetical protein